MRKPGFKLDFVTEDGVTFTLHNPPSKAVIGLKGFGFSGMEPTSIKFPYQHGERLLSKKLDPRTLEITLRITKECYNEYLTLREYLLATFRENRSYTYNPTLQHLIYRWVDNGVYKTREIDVYFSGKMTLNRPEADAWDQFSFTETIEFIAPYPIWYDPTDTSVTVSSWTSEAVLDMAFPAVFGCKYGSATINYVGTWESFPRFRFSGSFTNISIINVDTDQRINYTGAGSLVTLDLQTGPNLYARNIYTLDDYLKYFSGDLTSFSLQPSPPVTDNTLSIYAEGLSTTATVSIYYKNCYRGI
jgi:hypothetical protein